jgi:hypothetical protein
MLASSQPARRIRHHPRRRNHKRFSPIPSRSSKSRLVTRFAAIWIRVADGPPQCIGALGAQRMPGGRKVRLIGEHRSNGEHERYPPNPPSDTPLKTFAAAIKARWFCEQARRHVEEELRLYHFEGRSCAAPHRHVLMTMIAFASLPHAPAGSRRGASPSRRTWRGDGNGPAAMAERRDGNDVR